MCRDGHPNYFVRLDAHSDKTGSKARLELYFAVDNGLYLGEAFL